MAYRTTKISDLMVYDFDRVEGDLSGLRESDIRSVLPSGMNFKEFIKKVKSGDLILLNDSPSLPLLSKDIDYSGSINWSLNNQVSEQFDSSAQSQFLSRAAMPTGSGGSTQKYSDYELANPGYIISRARLLFPDATETVSGLFGSSNRITSLEKATEVLFWEIE